MGWPSVVPVFTKEDILIDPDQYQEGDKYTTIGWLKELFLYDQIDSEHLWISGDSYKIFKTVVDRLRQCGKIGAGVNLHQWEDEQSPAHQARILNRVCRSLGYTEIEEI